MLIDFEAASFASVGDSDVDSGDVLDDDFLDFFDNTTRRIRGCKCPYISNIFGFDALDFSLMEIC